MFHRVGLRHLSKFRGSHFYLITPTINMTNPGDQQSPVLDNTHDPPPNVTAASRVLHLPELLELVLLAASMCDGLKVYAASKSLKAMIDASTKLQIKLKFRYPATATFTSDTFVPHVLSSPSVGWFLMKRTSDFCRQGEDIVVVIGAFHNALGPVGTRWTKMPICHPPVTFMLINPVCKRYSTRCLRPISSRSGGCLTFGDLYLRASSIVESGYAYDECHKPRFSNTMLIFRAAWPGGTEEF